MDLGEGLGEGREREVVCGGVEQGESSRGRGEALSSHASSTRWCSADRGRERPVAAESEEQEGGGGNRCRELGRPRWVKA